MQAMASTCSICRCDYDEAECLPRILPDCGHTICSQCIRALLKKKNSSKCPLDNIKFPADKKTVEDFKVNFGLKQLIEEGSSLEICEKHHEKIRLLCFTDKQKICDDCVHLGEHKGHDIKSLKQVQPMIEMKAKNLEDILEKYDKQVNDTQNIFGEAKESLLLSVEKTFSEIRWQLNKKEAEIKARINYFVNSQTNKSIQLFGKNSQLKNEISEKIENFRNINKNKNIFELIEEDISSIIGKLNPETNENHSEKFLDSLREINQNFQESLNSCLLKISDITLPVQDLVKVSDDYFRNYSQDSQSQDENEVLSIFTNLELNFNNQILEITSKNSENTNLKVSLLKLRQIKEIKISLNNHFAAGIDSLIFIGDFIGDLESVELIGAPNDISDSVILNVITSIFGKPNCLKTIKLNLENCQISDECIRSFIETVLPRAIVLKNLELNFSNSKITNASIILLATNCSSTFKGLENLHLNFNGCKVTDESLSKLFIPMENIKALCLNFMNTEITDQTLESLSKNSLSSMRNLESLALLLSNTKVSDIGCTQLFVSNQNLKEVALAFSNTKITDMTIEVLASSLIYIKDQIQDFVLLAENTNVTDGSMTQLALLQMSNLKDIFIHLGSTKITNQTLDALANITFPSMKNLTSVSLGFSNTQITDEGAIKLIQCIPNVTTLTLNLSRTVVSDRFGEDFVRSLLMNMKTLAFLDFELLQTQLSGKALSIITEIKKEIQKRKNSTQ